VFWGISVYFNIRNTLPKSGTFLLGHSVYKYCQFVINSDTMHEKCGILRLKMILFQVRGLCKLIGGYQGVSQDILPTSSDGL